MNKKVLAILDGEARYAQGLMEYLSEKESLPFRVHIFTDRSRFNSFDGKDEIECLLVSESVYDEGIDQNNIPHLIILSESGKILEDTVHHINKYQSCENIYREVIKYYAENGEYPLSSLRKNGKRIKVIGIYTPIGRCLQTTFAFTLGQILSRKGKTLYMNFEQYSGFSRMLRKEFDSDISDLMYYFECAREKLVYRIESMVETINGLDFIPPAQIYQNLAGIKGDQWIELFREMERSTEYEYLILDMTDGMLDLWEVLRFCDIVYTISRNDAFALAKIEQYEKALTRAEYADVLEKTKKCKLPIFQNLPQNFEELTHSELASFLKERIVPDIERMGISDYA